MSDAKAKAVKEIIQDWNRSRNDMAHYWVTWTDVALLVDEIEKLKAENENLRAQNDTLRELIADIMDYNIEAEELLSSADEMLSNDAIARKRMFGLAVAIRDLVRKGGSG